MLAVICYSPHIREEEGGGERRREAEGGGGKRREEEGRGGKRRKEEGRGGTRREEEGRGRVRVPVRVHVRVRVHVQVQVRVHVRVRVGCDEWRLSGRAVRGRASGCARMSVRVRKSGRARACIGDDLPLMICHMVSRDTVLGSGCGHAGSGRARVDVWPGQAGGLSRTAKHSFA